MAKNMMEIIPIIQKDHLMREWVYYALYVLNRKDPKIYSMAELMLYERKKLIGPIKNYKHLMNIDSEYLQSRLELLELLGDSDG